MNKRRASIALALAGTAFFLWIALRQARLGDVSRALAAAHWEWLAPMIAIVYLDLLVRGARWRVLLSRARANAPILELTRLEAIGLGINNVVFLRLGELARAGLAARRLQIPLLASLASVVVERALDVAALLTIFVVASRLAPGYVLPSAWTAAVVVLAGALAALGVLAFAEAEVAEGGAINRFLKPWPRVHALVEQLALGAAVLREPASAARAAGLSLALWTVDAGLYWTGARALGLGALVDFPRAVLALSWAAATSALPAAPGGIGSFEAVVAAIMRLFGAAPDQALAYALVCHAVMYVFVTVTGLILLYRVGVSLADLRAEMEKR